MGCAVPAVRLGGCGRRWGGRVSGKKRRKARQGAPPEVGREMGSRHWGVLADCGPSWSHLVLLLGLLLCRFPSVLLRTRKSISFVAKNVLRTYFERYRGEELTFGNFP